MTVLSLCLTLTFSGCARHREQLAEPEPGLRLFNQEEIRAGERIHAEMLANYYQYTEPGVVEYVSKVGHALVYRGQRLSAPYRFVILYNDRVYATSAPGGYVYVTTGLIDFLDNEAQLAAVLAHEIGSLQYQDPRVNTGRKRLQGVTQTAAVIAPIFGIFGMLAMLGLVALNIASDSKELTDEERLVKADAWALEAMVKAGYDPQGMMDLMYKMLHAEEPDRARFFDYYEAHPITEERYRRLAEAFEKLPMSGGKLVTNSREFMEKTRGIHEMYSVAAA